MLLSRYMAYVSCVSRTATLTPVETTEYVVLIDTTVYISAPGCIKFEQVQRAGDPSSANINHVSSVMN